MGAWGPGSFDNDDASDWLTGLVESGDVSMVREAVSVTLPLDVPKGSTLMAAAEVVAAAMGAPPPALPDGVTAWVVAHRSDFTAADKDLTLVALERVQAHGSELAAVWDGDGEWTSTVAELRDRLAGVQPVHSSTGMSAVIDGDALSGTASAAARSRPAGGRALDWTAGDVFEVELADSSLRYFVVLGWGTPGRLAWVQVQAGVHAARPDDLRSLVDGPVHYQRLVLAAGVSSGSQPDRIGHVDLGQPDPIPIATLNRTKAGPDGRDRYVVKFADGRKLRGHDVPEQYRDLPSSGYVTMVDLVSEIRSLWSPPQRFPS